MKTIFAAAFLTLLRSTQAAPQTIQARSPLWSIYFWQSVSCTSSETGSVMGPDTVTVGNCYQIPYYGVTGSFDFYANSEYILLHLFSNDDCTGDEQSYQGLPDTPTCSPTDRFQSFRVDSHIKRDELVRSNQERGLIRLDKRRRLEERREFNANMAFGAAIATSTFAYMGALTCPPTAKDEDANKLACAISAITAIYAGFFTAYQLGGLYYHQGPTVSKRELVTHGLPHQDESILPGHRVTVHHVDMPADPDGTAWLHYAISAHNIDTGLTHNSTLRMHPTEDQQYIFANTEVDADDGTKKRAAQRATAYYAWTDSDKYYYDNTGHTSDVYNHLAVQTWNHGHSNGISSFCADIATVRSAHSWNSGYFALITGTFTNYADQC